MIRHCPICNVSYQPARMGQRVCSPRCAIRHGKQAKSSARGETKRRIDEVKPRSKWLHEAQAAFNAYIRLRDVHLPCVSCGRSDKSSWDAGHYLSTGARPELRFHEQNVWRQCVRCNQHLHGNLLLYRLELVRRIGMAAVEALEGPHPPAKFTIDQLREIRDNYRRRTRELAKSITTKES